MTQDKIKQVEKGCGKVALQSGYNVAYCGDEILCEVCQATLKTLKSCSEEITKLKEEELEFLRRYVSGFHKSNFVGNLNCECYDCRRMLKRIETLKNKMLK